VKLGLFTACLPGSTLEQVAEWASGHGYSALEVAAWPRRVDRPYQASHLDVTTLDDAGAKLVREQLDAFGIELSAVAYYENNLHFDPAERARVHDHLRRCIDAAAMLGCALVGTFVGRDVSKSVGDNLRLAEGVFPAMVSYAAEQGVRLVIENCPMEGWHPDGYPANLAYSPELWGWMAGLGLYLNFDPSHLLWLGVDPVDALAGHLDRVLHVQAKDAQIDARARNEFGVFGQVIDKRSRWDAGWWRYRVPGLGDVDWRRLIDVLYEGGYEGVVSVEHEDPVWQGTSERVRQGLLVAHRTLSPLLVD
jgi:sugar phosphate isomerase/epimerase